MTPRLPPQYNMHAVALACALFHVLTRPTQSLDLYTNALHANDSPATYALVLCTGLDAAITALRAHSLSEHAVGVSWLENNCVSIDPCTEVNSRGEAVPRGTWLHANSSALAFAATATHIDTAHAGTQAHNFGNLEYARVPEGLRIHTCAPDYDIWRREGVLVCNDDTVLTFTAGAGVRACPSAEPFSLLDCVRPLQHDAVTEHLHWRPPTQIMHFGSETWDTACAPPYSSQLIEVVCNISRDEYSIPIPKAAAYGTSSLIKYEFVSDYGCFDPAATNPGQVLSQEVAPNRIVSCAQVENGVLQASDAHTCDFTCNPGYVKHGSACVSECETFTTSCPPTFKHTDTCVANGEEHYACQACETREGRETLAWTPSTPVGTCQYATCDAGTYSSGHSCETCAVNTITDTTGQSQCTSCNSTYTGLYSAAPGGTACTDCLGHTLDSRDVKDICAAGREYVQAFDRVLTLFTLYTLDRPTVVLQHFIDAYCIDGYACLPCEPGYYELERVCRPCPHGTYQPNFGTSSCYACEDGQNTTSIASTAREQCVCRPGFA